MCLSSRGTTYSSSRCIASAIPGTIFFEADDETKLGEVNAIWVTGYQYLTPPKNHHFPSGHVRCLDSNQSWDFLFAIEPACFICFCKIFAWKLSQPWSPDLRYSTKPICSKKPMNHSSPMHLWGRVFWSLLMLPLHSQLVVPDNSLPVKGGDSRVQSYFDQLRC